MKNIEQKLAYFDRQTVTGEMNEKGNALVSRFLSGRSCDELIRKYNNSDLYHKTSTIQIAQRKSLQDSLNIIPDNCIELSSAIGLPIRVLG
jgi:hypothetical protein